MRYKQYIEKETIVNRKNKIWRYKKGKFYKIYKKWNKRERKTERKRKRKWQNKNRKIKKKRTIVKFVW